MLACRLSKGCSRILRLRATDEDVVDGNVYWEALARAEQQLEKWRMLGGRRTQLDNVADCAHDEEADTDSLA